VSAVQTDGAETPKLQDFKFNPNDRRHFFGGSDAHIIMGNDDADLLHLWREKRGEIAPPDFSNNLVVQLGTFTEELNRSWYPALHRSDGQGRPAASPPSGPQMDVSNA
jgi:predicted phage-related endonuclease